MTCDLVCVLMTSDSGGRVWVTVWPVLSHLRAQRRSLRKGEIHRGMHGRGVVAAGVPVDRVSSELTSAKTQPAALGSRGDLDAGAGGLDETTARSESLQGPSI